MALSSERRRSAPPTAEPSWKVWVVSTVKVQLRPSSETDHSVISPAPSMTSKLLSSSIMFSYTSEQMSWLAWFVATSGR